MSLEFNATDVVKLDLLKVEKYYDCTSEVPPVFGRGFINSVQSLLDQAVGTLPVVILEASQDFSEDPLPYLIYVQFGVKWMRQWVPAEVLFKGE